MKQAVITGTGFYVPPHAISNEEIVDAFNCYVERFNQTHAAQIESGEITPLLPSSAEFILKASGIQNRFVLEKTGILDPEIMCPQHLERDSLLPSYQCEMAVEAAKMALSHAKVFAQEIDLVIVSCSNLQRAYPGVAIEIQAALQCTGFAFDMNAACASATYGLSMAKDLIQAGSVTRALVINPEICSGHINFKDRESHFIFGDACTAVVVEREDVAKSPYQFRIESTRLKTQFSNNIRNNFGFLNRTTPETQYSDDKLFRQQGRKVFKEVVPFVSEWISQHLNEAGLHADHLKRLWLHQANINMNDLITRKVYGRAVEAHEVPIILNQFANTSSAGVILALHHYHQDLKQGDKGLICAFGAGYSVGSVLLECVASPLSR